MTAAEAARINEKEEAIDNSADIVHQVRHAARRRERSIEVSENVMTYATVAKLEKLGYTVTWKRLEKPTTRDWNAMVTVYVVSW